MITAEQAHPDGRGGERQFHSNRDQQSTDESQREWRRIGLASVDCNGRHVRYLWGPITPSGGVPRMLAVRPAEQRAEKSAQGGPYESKHGAGLDADGLLGPRTSKMTRESPGLSPIRPG